VRVRASLPSAARDIVTQFPAVRVATTLLVAARPYAVHVTVCCRPASDDDSSAALDSLGSLELRVPLVAGIALVARDALEALEIGDALVAGGGLWLRADGTGRAVLAAPTAESGCGVQLAKDGTIVVSGELTALSHDSEDAMSPNDDNADLHAAEQAALDAPIVVRVEIGAVAMAARDWARLRPGDVIETGRRIAEPVILRVAGQDVAHGELVNVEGEIGVRIRKLMRIA
jgi:flagellar motor switch/type III secretory pathway protein FliN